MSAQVVLTMTASMPRLMGDSDDSLVDGNAEADVDDNDDSHGDSDDSVAEGDGDSHDETVKCARDGCCRFADALTILQLFLSSILLLQKMLLF